jgi:hypothetical protein
LVDNFHILGDFNKKTIDDGVENVLAREFEDIILMCALNFGLQKQ